MQISLDLASLRTHYLKGALIPTDLITHLYRHLSDRGDDGIWTYQVPEADALARAKMLEELSPERRATLPLWGIPFSVKDCIDIAGLPTTAACPGFRYLAEQTNPAIAQLLQAGAILIGKTNLDQFATGLVGIRTGFTVPRNSFHPDYIPGGSSSGAALSVASGLVSFAIGTDTGGSGRVPAGFNNIVGLKPTRGVLSNRHSLDVCRTLDCLSIFALTATDAWEVLQVAEGYDPGHALSRPRAPAAANLTQYQLGQPFRVGIPQARYLEFFGNSAVERQFEQAIATLMALGGTCVEIDYGPFQAAVRLLFQGPWVAERYVSFGAFIEAHPDAVLPLTREIILGSKWLSAMDVFKGLYQLADLRQAIEPLWEQMDILVVPTTGTCYRIAEIEADPLQLNTNLGYYTNFVNLLDLAAIALPNGFQQDGVPCGITAIAPPFTERYLTQLGAAFHPERSDSLGATPFNYRGND